MIEGSFSHTKAKFLKLLTQVSCTVLLTAKKPTIITVDSRYIDFVYLE